jgi:outer membrane protein TolC
MIAKQQLQDQKRLLIWEIKKQFAESLSVQSILEATNRSIELNKKLHEFTVARVNEGEAAAIEKSLSQIESSRLEL